MRPKIVLVILLAAAVMLAVVVVVSKKSRPQTAVAPVEAAKSVAVAVPAPAPEPLVAVVVPAPVAIVTNNGGTNMVEEKKLAHEEYINTRADKLMGLAMLKDPAAHQKIVDALHDPDRAIRTAALDALEQANDRSVIPQMQQIADQTDDPDDKQAIEDAIDYIQLPSLTEYLKARKAAKAAVGNSSAPTQPANGSSNPPR